MKNKKIRASTIIKITLNLQKLLKIMMNKHQFTTQILALNKKIVKNKKITKDMKKIVTNN